MAKTNVVASLMIGAGAVALWAASRMSWITVTAFDDKSGEKTVDLIGSLWSTESSAVGLVLAVACIAGVALRRLGRRVVGIIAAVAAAGAAWSPMQLLFSAPDASRVLGLLSSDNSTSRSDQGALLSGWAEISTMSVQVPALVVALLGCGLALFGGIILAMRPGADTAKRTQYERTQARHERVLDDLESDPDSGRVLWDAIDADIDPTDPAGPAGQARPFGSTDSPQR
ncbi:TIGR02234 family membrane protein [Corynebacterium sp. SCR221107]|uniref:TIGR02234 family membrane protein n=1 Tax=Corynebacterium sp. SCR221107 TaxID=3017361 RepID=UPI0022EC540C|nr:TIGR02234 family membrane protein [Corynebacterium sp. SCR221107]WBT07966.1 TIGR02234 family membrane protein [Corynebacterium sp. SCR221107]